MPSHLGKPFLRSGTSMAPRNGILRCRDLTLFGDLKKMEYNVAAPSKISFVELGLILSRLTGCIAILSPNI